MTAVRALILDFGGVLTASTVQASRDWCASTGISYRQFVGPLVDEGDGRPGLIHRLETGAMPVADFERDLGAAISAVAGFPVDASGFVRDVVGGAPADEAMFDLVTEARTWGLRTAMLSNSWGNDYPLGLLEPYFDDIVISGEVGIRKPDPQIYLLAARRLGVTPQECVFIDDLKANVAAAESVGMAGIVHTDAATTRRALLASVAAADRR